MTSKQKHDPGRKKRLIAELRGPVAMTKAARRVKRAKARVASYPPGKAPADLRQSLAAAVKNQDS